MSTTFPPGGAVRKLEDLDPGGARHWWVFIVTGTLWLLFSIIVFRFNIDSVTGIGIAVGALCIAAGTGELVTSRFSVGGWKVARIVLGILLALVGVVALLYPHRTFIEVAAIFSFFLLFKGAFDIFSALVLRHATDLWWTVLLVGVAEVLLAFWAAGNFGRQAVLLVVWVGAGALARGVMDYVLAVRLRQLRSDGLPVPVAPA
jgi:uncharacterized membrane protein HdeD (DUF308 family)